MFTDLMTFALGHLVGAWFAGKGYEFCSRKKIPHLAWFFLLWGGLLPDVDFILDWTLGTEFHRTFTHSLLFLAAVPMIMYLVAPALFRLLFNEEIPLRSCAVALAGGIAVHLFLDMATTGPGVPLFWPNLLYFSLYSTSYFDPVTPSFLYHSADRLRYYLKLTIVDMAIGIAWIFYLWFRKKIDF